MTWLHRFTRIVAAATFLLVVAGGVVTSTASGLSVPDWPTSYGWGLLVFPFSRWVGGVFYGQGHRLIASAVGVLTIAMVFTYWRIESRRWVTRLAIVALNLVVIQAILGGFNVLTGLPAVVSSAHAGLAQIFFALTVALTELTSPGWLSGYGTLDRQQPPGRALAADGRVRWLSLASICAVYLQMTLGAAVRHTGSGLAIPDYPLAFGRLVPPLAALATPAVAFDFAHRFAAVLATMTVLALCWRVFRTHHERRELVRPAAWLVTLIATQVLLGGATVLSGRQALINTAHLAAGALTFVTTVVLALRVHRPFFRGSAIPAGRAALRNAAS